MIITWPDYYKDFSCIADQCEDTCCAGWQIQVDQKSLKQYQNEKSVYKNVLRNRINWKEHVFKQGENARCSFLREDNLCDMYCHLGEKSLCKTCRTYPRHVEEFENVREITLSISCPEVAKMILTNATKVRFFQKEIEGTETYEMFDYFLYQTLVDSRDELMDIAQNRKSPIENRSLLLLGMAHDIQRRYDQNFLYDCESVYKKSHTKASREKMDKIIKQVKMGDKRNFLRIESHFYHMYGMERLHEDWEQVLLEFQEYILGNGSEYYNEIVQEFKKWTEIYAPKLSIKMEQLLVYFITTYYVGAVYDGRIYGKIQASVAYVELIYHLWMLSWLKNDKCLYEEDMINLSYRFSRELEHSDINLVYMENYNWFKI